MPESNPVLADPEADPAGTSRRTLLRGAVIAGVATPILAACGGDEESSASADPTSTPPANAGTPPDGGESSASGGGGGAEAIATTGDVPEGGGIIVAESGIVITQPSPGEFKGFTNICTHQSCKLDNVDDGTINCICHGSQFSIEDGTPVTGPRGQSADSIDPLAEMPVTVQGTNITLA